MTGLSRCAGHMHNQLLQSGQGICKWAATRWSQFVRERSAGSTPGNSGLEVVLCWQKLQWRLLAGLLRERESPQGMPGQLGLHSGVDDSAELRSM